MLKKRKKNFVILGTPRSKSTLLVYYLQQHPETFCHEELFNPHQIIHIKGSREIVDSKLLFINDMNLRDEHPFTYTDKVYAYQRRLKNQIVGFKLLFGQQNLVMDYLLNKKQIKKIIILRNFLFCFSSLEIAQKTQEWRLQKKLQKKQEKISMSPLAFLNYFDWNFNAYLRLIRQLQTSGQDYHLLFAEDFPSLSSLDALFEFLEVSPSTNSFQERLYQQNSSQIDDRLENADEVRALFSDTILAPFLDADKVPGRDFWVKKPLDQAWIDETLAGIQALREKWQKTTSK